MWYRIPAALQIPAHRGRASEPPARLPGGRRALQEGDVGKARGRDVAFAHRDGGPPQSTTSRAASATSCADELRRLARKTAARWSCSPRGHAHFATRTPSSLRQGLAVQRPPARLRLADTPRVRRIASRSGAPRERSGPRPDNELLETLREEIVHALEGLEPSGPISGAVHGERRDRRPGRADALLQALQGRIAIRRMERVAIVAERRRHHAGLTERRLHALDHGRGIEFRRGVSPPVLEEGKVVGRHDLLGVRHLKEVGVPDAFVALVARGEVAAEGRGMGRADGDDALDALGGERGRAVRGRGPPIVTDRKARSAPAQR